MAVQLTSEQVWKVIEKEVFAVMGMVTAKCEARTVGIVYVARNHRLYIATDKDAWKTRHIAQNPHVSLTIPIHKGIPLMPWLKIPAATITFSGLAQILEPAETPPEIMQAIFRDMANDQELIAESCLLEVTPINDFVTYGIGVSLMKMRDPEQARGRVPVAGKEEEIEMPHASA
ncbi:MAG: pyridoxamine 5'-phosphate oxidase family protein [Anaerolineae bacterium]|nr:pyridoxamine 5'-phosphate oxidase family protein [Anaerolineae bacterium]